jgi:hypothetical protein
MAADDSSNQYKKTLKALNDMLEKQKALNKSAETIKESWKAISSELFKIDGADFFKEVPKTSDELKEMSNVVNKLQQKFNQAGEEFAKMIDPNQVEKLTRSLQGISKFTEFDEINGKKTLKNSEKLNDVLREIRKDNIALSHLDDNAIIDLAEKIRLQQELNDGIVDWKKIIEESNSEQRIAVALMHENAQELININNGMTEAAEMAAKIKEEMLKPNEVFQLGNAFDKVFVSLGKRMRNEVLGTLTEFDTVLHKVQKETSIRMDENAYAFSRLTTSVQQYGVGVEEAGQMMADMSKELKTTDFNLLSKATQDFAMIAGATGAASEDITTIAGELMRMGESSGQVKDFMQEADQQARMFGVSSSKVLGGISKNIKKMREMGFTGGEKSLMRMAVTAERLRMNIDETFDMAKRARSIEGAMDMAAELQLAGGSFSNINPMDLLSAARKGPAELQRILTTMGKDIGHFDEEQQKYVFDPVDVDRLQMVSEATGQSMESLQNMIAKNAEDIEKTNMFSGLIDSMDEADREFAKSSIADMMKKNKDGTIEFDASSDMAKKMGIESLEELQNMDASMLKKKMEDNKETLEAQNKANQDLKQSFDNFIKSLLSVLTVFQPILEALGWIFQTLNGFFQAIGKLNNVFEGLGTGLQLAITGMLIAAGIFGKSVISLLAAGAKDKISSVANKILKRTPTGGEDGASLSGTGSGSLSSQVSQGKSMAEKLKGISESVKGFFDVIRSAVQGIMGIIGDVFRGVGEAIAGFFKAFTSVSFTDIIKGALALGVMAGALWLMGEALGKFSDVGLEELGIAALTIIGLTAAVVGLGAIMPLILSGSLALGVMSAAFWVFGLAAKSVAEAMPAISSGFSAFSDIDGGNLLSVAAGIGALSYALVAFGAATAMGGVMSLFGGGMFTQISELALLAPAISILAQSLNSAADGVLKLSVAAEKLNIEKLEKLKDVSMSMANNMKKASETETQRVQAVAPAKQGDGETRKIEINLKLNGRDLQQFLINDTKVLK